MTEKKQARLERLMTCEYCGAPIEGTPAVSWDGTLPLHTAPMHFDFCTKDHFVKWRDDDD